MSAMDTFEQDLTAAMRAYLKDAPVEIDARGLVRGFAVAHPRRRPVVELPIRLFGWQPGWLALLALLAVAALALALAGGSPTPPVPAPTPTSSPTPAARNGLLAFTRGPDVFLADQETGRSLKPAGTTGLFLGDWSPDGRWLSLFTERDTFLLDVATMQLAPAPLPQLVAESATPTPTTPVGPTAAPIAMPPGPAPFGYGPVGWLRYGRSILLHEWGAGSVFAVDIETGATFKLPDVRLCGRSLSPDARYLARISDKSVVVIDVATGSELVISEFGGDGCGMGAYGFDAPSWSPDGLRLVVVTAGAIRVVNRDGSDGVDIVNLDFLPPDRTDRPVRPLWAPGGKWIAFHGPEGLEIIRPDGTDRRPLVKGDIDDRKYSWTPDSARIDYGISVTVPPGDDFVLFSVDVATGIAEPIAVAEPYVQGYAREPITDETPLVTLPTK